MLATQWPQREALSKKSRSLFGQCLLVVVVDGCQDDLGHLFREELSKFKWAFAFVSSDRSSNSDSVLLYIQQQRPFLKFWALMPIYIVLWFSMMFYVLRAFSVFFFQSVPPEFFRSFFNPSIMAVVWICILPSKWLCLWLFNVYSENAAIMWKHDISFSHSYKVVDAPPNEQQCSFGNVTRGWSAFEHHCQYIGTWDFLCCISQK